MLPRRKDQVETAQGQGEMILGLMQQTVTIFAGGQSDIEPAEYLGSQGTDLQISKVLADAAVGPGGERPECIFMANELGPS